MSDAGQMLADTAERVFPGLIDSPIDASWAVLTEAGFPALMTAEDEGGFGGDWSDCFVVQRLAGYYAVPAPLGEHAVACRLLGGQELPGGDGLATIAAQADGELSLTGFTGRLSGVPWGRHAATVVAELGGALFAIATAGAVVSSGENLAGEPRDALSFINAPALRLTSQGELFTLGALLRVGQIAGALDRAFAMSIQYANEREQFGRPLAKFQAVQQGLASVAEAAAAANSAGRSAAAAQDRGGATFEIAAAKLRADMAVDLGAALTHQVHGAIGFTQDHTLHRYTRRLQSWRGEFGNDRHWAERLGRMVTAEWAGGLWQGLTARGDA